MGPTPNNSLETKPEDGFIVDAEQIEALREIINAELRLEVSVQEAKKLGGDALLFFKALAGNRGISTNDSGGGVVQHG